MLAGVGGWVAVAGVLAAPGVAVSMMSRRMCLFLVKIRPLGENVVADLEICIDTFLVIAN